MAIRTLDTRSEHRLEAACRAVEIEPASLAQFLTRTETVAVVAESGDRPVGLAYGHELLHPDGRKTMLLYSIDVSAAHRGRGHGRALVAAFVDEARKRACSEVWTLTEPDNVAAQATYLAAGGVRDEQQSMFVWPLHS